MSYARCLLTGRWVLSPSIQMFRPALHSRAVTLKATPATPPPKLTHEEKNEGVRPMSPHLLIYKPQLTSMMSISHRITGLMMAGYATVLAAGSFVSYDVCSLADTIKNLSLPGFVTFTVKYTLAFPAVYHFFNGIRHLFWDMGKGLTIKEVYLSGYVVLALTVAFSVLLSK
ncbi:succinate dehydrogenase cytochrome B subunit, mitochondrial-like [Cimex lectularius]|uniref:Succinate dehydrogenase cytochrome b560 subunit, mitochondrial n=1 Tax=Cimex lectularius TaxID=79782 RepID=A0A8I6RCM4_CIMLE|nr:succinate dehydrogenase cytochrome B subunit, mitochondrial-like [Cimex lectularius]